MDDLRNLIYSISFNDDVKGLQQIVKAENEIDNGLKKAAKSTSKMTVEFDKVADKADDAASATDDIGNQAQKSEFSIKSLGKAIAGAFVVKKIVDFGKQGVAAFADFEQGMANVNAAMGNIGAKSPKDFKMLEDAALEWGAKTKYSATEASQALYFTASAGFDAKTQVEVLPKVLNLAAAGNIDLAKAAEISTTSMGALGLGVNDLGKLIDQMGRTSQISQTNISELGEAVITVGGVAKSANLNAEGLNAELAILADRGKKGAEGGTALRNVLVNLTAPNDTVSQLMKELGVNIADSTGKIRPLNSILVDLKKKTSGYTQAQQMAIKETIGGKENIEALNILLEGSGDKYNSLTSRIKASTGASQEMADVQNNTLTGAIENLSGSIESAFITDVRDSNLGTSMTDFVNLLADKAPAAVDTAADALGGLVDIFRWIVDNGDAVSAGIAGILTAILTYKAIGGIVAIYDQWKKATEGITIAQATLNFIMGQNPVARVITLVAGLAAMFIYAYNHSETFRTGVNSLFEGMKDGAQTAINFVIDKLNWAIEKANGLIGLMNKIPGVEISTISGIGQATFANNPVVRGSGGHSVSLSGEYARGTVNAIGGTSLVGEDGPELINLNKGDTVTPTNTTRRILGNSNRFEFNPSINITVAGGNDPQSTAKAVKEVVRQQIEEMFAMASVQLGYTDLQPSN